MFLSPELADIVHCTRQPTVLVGKGDMFEHHMLLWSKLCKDVTVHSNRNAFPCGRSHSNVFQLNYSDGLYPVYCVSINMYYHV